MSNKEYIVEVQEVHKTYVSVSAENEQDAIDKVAKGKGQEFMTEYSNRLDPKTWKAVLESEW